MKNKYTNLSLVILFFLSVFQSINAQKVACGTPALTNEQRREILIQRSRYEKSGKSSRAASDTGITYIPVRINIFRNNDQTGGLSLQEMNDGMSKANKTFLKAGKGIQFYLAGEKPNYADDSTLATFLSEAKDASGKTTQERATAKFSVKNAINLFSAGRLVAGKKELGGYAYFPRTDNGSNLIVMANSVFNDKDNTLAHEFGHYFSLPHTFDRTSSEDMSERELVTRLKTETKGRKPANCDTGGDMICDTPSDPYDFKPKVVNCAYADTTIKDANGDLYNPMTNNIMDYYFCTSVVLTAGQFNVMGGSALSARMSKDAEYNFRPDSTWKPTIVINPIIAKPKADSLNNVTITWKDNSSNEMGFFVERATNFKGPFVAVGGTAPDSTVFVDRKVANNMKYYYRIKPSNTTINSLSKVDSVTVGEIQKPISGLVCLPKYVNSCLQGDGISNFTLQGVDSTGIKNESSCDSGSYSNFSKLSADVVKGKKYLFSIGNKWSKQEVYFPQSVAIWMDVDKNGEFTGTKPGESEMIYRGTILAGKLSDSLLIPKIVGGKYTVRIRIRRASYGIVNNACELYEHYGEGEDYSLVVKDSARTKQSTPVSLRVDNLQSETKEDSKKIYPNPSDGNQIYVMTDNSDEAKISMYDLAGREVQTLQNPMSQYVMSIKPNENLKIGTYIILVQEGKNIKKYKMSVMK
ncbi:MAG: T9SS type A sorting domain-containing protein [Arcicella sp.]|nr:T9SS type A sorting domain-containing protein [Arcicella sp.]